MAKGREQRNRGRKSGIISTCGLMGILTIIIGVGPAMYGQDRGATMKGEAVSEVARGKYLVEGVAMCGQCHTPRDSSGALDRSKWLEGAAVPWMPSQPQAGWPLIAPRIGGTPPASDADMIRLLTTGIWTNGKQLRFPMMPFRMSEAEARAVVAYLKTPSAWN